MTYKQVFIINQDLNMSKGKIAVQVAHGEVYYIEEVLETIFENETLTKYDNYVKWRYDENELMKKVVLKGNEKEMNSILSELAIKKIAVFSVHDKGLTQVAPNSFTCVCVEPLLEEQCTELFGHLKLL